MMLEPPVECAPTQPQHLGSLAHVATMTLECFPDEHALDFLERQVLQAWAGATGAKSEIGGADPLTVRQQHGPLKRVVELADIARPRMRPERVERLGLEAGQRL